MKARPTRHQALRDRLHAVLRVCPDGMSIPDLCRVLESPEYCRSRLYGILSSWTWKDRSEQNGIGVWQEGPSKSRVLCLLGQGFER
jgi:hypothetical protein